MLFGPMMFFEKKKKMCPESIKTYFDHHQKVDGAHLWKKVGAGGICPNNFSCCRKSKSTYFYKLKVSLKMFALTEVSKEKITVLKIFSS